MGLFALVGCVMVLTVLLGLVQKWLWMRELDYAGIFWTLLSVKWGMFGVALVFASLYLWIKLLFAAKRIDFSREQSPLFEGCHSCPSGRVFATSADALRRLNVDLSPKVLMLGERCSHHVRFSYIRGLGGFHAMGHLSPLSLWWIVSGSPTRSLGLTLASICSAFPSMNYFRGTWTFLTVGALAILGLIRPLRPSAV